MFRVLTEIKRYLTRKMLLKYRKLASGGDVCVSISSFSGSISLSGFNKNRVTKSQRASNPSKARAFFLRLNEAMKIALNFYSLITLFIFRCRTSSSQRSSRRRMKMM